MSRQFRDNRQIYIEPPQLPVCANIGPSIEQRRIKFNVNISAQQHNCQEYFGCFVLHAAGKVIKIGKSYLILNCQSYFYYLSEIGWKGLHFLNKMSVIYNIFPSSFCKTQCVILYDNMSYWKHITHNNITDNIF